MSTPSEIRNARKFAQAQAHYDAMTPPDDDTCTSLQKLGDAQVLVDFSNDGGIISINGCWIGAEFVDSSEFSGQRIEGWRSAITAEYEYEQRLSIECDNDRWGAL